MPKQFPIISRDWENPHCTGINRLPARHGHSWFAHLLFSQLVPQTNDIFPLSINCGYRIAFYGLLAGETGRYEQDKYKNTCILQELIFHHLLPLHC